MSQIKSVYGNEFVDGFARENMITKPTTAEVGQMLVVKAVDENGVPTEWEVSDVASGGSGDIPTEPIIDVTLEEDVAELIISTDKDGNSFDLSRGYILAECAPIIGNTSNDSIKVGFGNKASYYLAKTVKETDNGGYGLLFFDRRDGIMRAELYRSFNHTNVYTQLVSSQLYNNGHYMVNSEGVLTVHTNITRFKIFPNVYSLTPIALGAGSRIRVWGK